MDGLAKESTQMYAQSLNAEALDFSGRVAVEERLKAVEIEIFNRKVDFNRLQCHAVEIFQPHFSRARNFLT